MKNKSNYIDTDYIFSPYVPMSFIPTIYDKFSIQNYLTYFECECFNWARQLKIGSDELSHPDCEKCKERRKR